MKRAFCILAMLSLVCFSSQPNATADEILEKGPVVAKSGLSIKVRAEGPATRQTALQIACFFEYGADDVMTGGTELFDEKMKGVIKKLRQSGIFEGHALETLLLKPAKDTVPAKNLLLIGLGEKKTFTLDRMESVGKVAVREALKMNVDAFSMSPNVTDAGVTKFPVGEFDRALVQGVLSGYKAQTELNAMDLGLAPALKEFTLEAGEKNVPSAFEAVQKAVNQAK